MGGRLLLVLLFLEMATGPVVEVLAIVARVCVRRLLGVHLRGEDGEKVEEGALVGVEVVRCVLDEVGIVGYLHAVAVVIDFRKFTNDFTRMRRKRRE